MSPEGKLKIPFQSKCYFGGVLNRVVYKLFFNEIAIRVPKNAWDVVGELAKNGVIGGVAMSRLNPKAGMDDVIITCATEMNADEDIVAYAKALKEVLP